MAILSRLSGTFQSLFQIGNGGPKIKNNSGTLEVRNAADSAYANVEAAQGRLATVLVGGNATIKDGGAGIVVFRNAADSADAIIRAANPVGSADVLTLGYYNANAPTSAAAMKAVRIASGNYATTYTTAATLPNNAVVTRCVVVVTAPLDAGITLKVGTDEAGQDARFMLTTDNNPQAIETYETTPFSLVKTTGGSGSDQDLVVTLSSTPTTGTVTVFVEYVVAGTW